MASEKYNSIKSQFPGKKPGSIIFFLIATTVLFAFLISYCTPQSCFEETNAYVRVMFYDTTGKVRTPDSLTLYGLGADTTALYLKAKNIKPALLPLDASDGNSVFIIKINGITDTLTFNYTSYPHLISQECGYSFYHVIDSPFYSRNIIKWITVRNKNITTANEENIRIHY